jgi:hypothetical protein
MRFVGVVLASYVYVNNGCLQQPQGRRGVVALGLARVQVRL